MSTQTKSIKQALIAVVDDDQSVCEALESLLASIGMDAATFCTARSFLESPRFPSVDCAILDVSMPEMDGIELQRQLVATHPIPVIFITAHWDEKTRQQAMQAGAVRFLSKPFSDDALIDALQSALNA
jgi:FixJ family two-component response regulator